MLRAQVGRCYRLPTQVRSGPPVVVEVRLNRDGSLAQLPQVLSRAPDARVADAALHALARCTPFRVPVEFAGIYPRWRVLQIQFDTQ